MPEKMTDERFEDTPRGWASRWTVEFAAAEKEQRKWRKTGEKVVKKFLDERESSDTNESRLNLFTANTQTLAALLYGKMPQVSVTRRFNDADDDVARVAGEMLQRILNADIERDEDGFAHSIKLALSDRLLPGMGNVRVRYEGTIREVEPLEEDGEEKAPGYAEVEDEDVDTLYAHWSDQLWSPARVFSEVRWWAFKTQLTEEEVKKRFPKAKGVPLNAGKAAAIHNDEVLDARQKDPWSRAEVWEIWDKATRKVFWYVKGYDEVLEVQDDPYGLDGFWPFPHPLFANLTTSKLLPRPDYALAQDLYREIDTLTSRITLLENAVRVVGCYDASSGELRRLLSSATQNELIPVANWAMFAEKGGLQGVVNWFPLEQVVNALVQLREYRTEQIGLLYQVTGMSDIMRGQATTSATATEQSIKARFASVRVQSLQDEFARFATDTQKLRAELISKHFAPETIIQRSNILNTPDAPLAQQAAALIKSEFSLYRIEVKPEAVNLQDFAALKQERSELLGVVATYLQGVQPIAAAMPQAMPFLMEFLKWTVAGYKGSSTLEGVLDRFTQQVQQAIQQQQQNPPGPPPPDPKVELEKLKQQGHQQKVQTELQADLTRIGAENKAALQQGVQKVQGAIMSEEAKQRAKALQAVNDLTTRGGPVA